LPMSGTTLGTLGISVSSSVSVSSLTMMNSTGCAVLISAVALKCSCLQKIVMDEQN
jgi:hypothetical protein